MKQLNTLLPLRKLRSFCCATTAIMFALLSSFPSYSQCDINIFQRGTSSGGSVSLMPWLSYSSGCDITNDCGQLTTLVLWDMEEVDPCGKTLAKPDVTQCKSDVGTTTKLSQAYFATGSKGSSQSLAIGNGQSARFKANFKPKSGQSGQVMHLIYDVKSVANTDELLCGKQKNLKPETKLDYSITILSRGKQVYLGLKHTSASWENEIIDLDFISNGENLYEDGMPLELEIIINNFTTSGDAVLGLDNLLLEGKECLFNDNLAYEWSTGEKTEKIYSIKKGNYCVTVTDCNGCQAVDCISVN